MGRRNLGLRPNLVRKFAIKYFGNTALSRFVHGSERKQPTNSDVLRLAGSVIKQHELKHEWKSVLDQKRSVKCRMLVKKGRWARVYRHVAPNILLAVCRRFGGQCYLQSVKVCGVKIRGLFGGVTLDCGRSVCCIHDHLIVCYRFRGTCRSVYKVAM